MEANSTHISLETAKLLKDCKVESEYGYYATAHDNYETYSISGNRHYWKGQPNYPAYTWQEILWEYSKEFFGDEERVVWIETLTFANHLVSETYTPGKSAYILDLLQKKEYDEADEYFRENCILIKK
jgi:hypothetical protein